MDMDLKSYYELGVQKLRRVLAHFQTRVLLIEDAVGNGWGAWLEEGGDGRRLLDEHGLGFVRQQVPIFFTSERESCAERPTSCARSSCTGGGIDLHACITWFRVEGLGFFGS